MKKQPLLLLMAILLLSGFTIFTNDKVIDYLNVPGPITFNQLNYHFSWSAHPNNNYYKHEYLPNGETGEKYSKMLLLEAVTGDFSVKDIVNAQIKMMEERKKTDAFARYELIENADKGEVILDFMLSDGHQNGAGIVEWNAYRYKAFSDKSGHKGVLLLGISMRGYGKQVESFLKLLKNDRVNVRNALAAYHMPDVTVKAL
jgi:hypothetical protein